MGFDGTDDSRAALDVAHSVAAATGARLNALAVVHRPSLGRRDHGGAVAGHREALQKRLDEALAGRSAIASGVVVDGDPIELLADAATEADMLVLGARGYGPRHHVFVGSVSSKLMRTSPTPVMLVPRPPAEESEDAPA